ASAQLVELAKQFDETSLGIGAAGDAAGATLRDIGAAFRQQVQELSGGVEQTVGRMQSARSVLNEHFGAIADATGAVSKRLQELAEAALVHRQILEFNGLLEQANARLESARVVLRDQASELNAATDLAVDRLRDVAEIYHGQSASLVGAAEQAGGRAREA